MSGTPTGTCDKIDDLSKGFNFVINGSYKTDNNYNSMNYCISKVVFLNPSDNNELGNVVTKITNTSEVSNPFFGSLFGKTAVKQSFNGTVKRVVEDIKQKLKSTSKTIPVQQQTPAGKEPIITQPTINAIEEAIQKAKDAAAAATKAADEAADEAAASKKEAVKKADEAVKKADEAVKKAVEDVKKAVEDGNAANFTEVAKQFREVAAQFNAILGKIEASATGGKSRRRTTMKHKRRKSGKYSRYSKRI